MKTTNSKDLARETCLFLNRQRQSCQAHGTNQPVGENRRRHFCTSDNFDACPTYLAYLLRRSQPQSRHDRQHEFLFK